MICFNVTAPRMARKFDYPTHIWFERGTLQCDRATNGAEVILTFAV